MSSLGDWLATFAFMTLIYALTGQSSAVALILVLRLIPPIFAGPVGGVFADRMSRRAIMVSADIIRAVIITLVPFVNITYLYVLAFLHECISLFFLPARDAFIPQLVPDDKLEAGNGLILASGNGVLPLAGVLFSLIGRASGVYPGFLPFAGRINQHPETFAFFTDALSFLVSAALIARIHARADQKRIQKQRQMNFIANFRRSMAVVWKSPSIRRLAYGITAAMFGGGVLFAVGVGYVHQTLHQSSTAFGWLITLWGVGMALGLIGVRYLARHHGRFYVFETAMVAIGAILVSMSLVPVATIAFALAAPFGAAFAIALILATTLAQEHAADDTRGATLGGLQSLYSLGLALGALCMGGIASVFNHIVVLRMTLDGNQIAMFSGGLLICIGALFVGAPVSLSARLKPIGDWFMQEPARLYKRLLLH